jgi:hypothetical protein
MSNQTSNAETTTNLRPDVGPVNALNHNVSKSMALFRILEDRIIAEIEENKSTELSPRNRELEGVCALIFDTIQSLEAAKDGMNAEWDKLRDYYHSTNKAA